MPGGNNDVLCTTMTQMTTVAVQDELMTFSEYELTGEEEHDGLKRIEEEREGLANDPAERDGKPVKSQKVMSKVDGGPRRDTRDARDDE